MNPVAMTIINPRKEYWPCRDRTSDLVFSSPQRYRLNYGAQLNSIELDIEKYIHYFNDFLVGLSLVLLLQEFSLCIHVGYI